MQSIRARFTDHPAAVGESYGEHFVVASGFGLRMVVAGLACLVHAVLPFLFVRTGSAAIEALHARMITHRRTKPAASSDAPAPARG